MATSFTVSCLQTQPKPDFDSAIAEGLKLAEKSLIPPSVFSEFLSMHPNNTQESNHSSGANGFSSKISRIAHFAVMMSEYGELTSVQDANREQRNPTNVSHKTKHHTFI